MKLWIATVSATYQDISKRMYTLKSIIGVYSTKKAASDAALAAHDKTNFPDNVVATSWAAEEFVLDKGRCTK